jgi:hypothetical protein
LNLGYAAGVNSDPLEINERTREEYHARWEAVEICKAHELAAMTDQRALEIIQSLGAPEAWLPHPDWSGLVEQQAIFCSKSA